MLQEILLAAWRGLGGCEGRSPLCAWPYRIATNRCLTALRDSERRKAGPPRDVPTEPPFAPPPLTRRGEPLWLEPYPDALLDDLAEPAPGPEARYEARESIALAFVAAV